MQRLLHQKMSRSSKKITLNNNVKTRSGRSATERFSRVFRSTDSVSVVQSVLLYRLVFMSKKAALLSILLTFCFVTQSAEFARAEESEIGTPEIELPAEVQFEVPAPLVEDTSEPEQPEPAGNLEMQTSQATEIASAAAMSDTGTQASDITETDSPEDIQENQSSLVASSTSVTIEEEDTLVATTSINVDENATTTATSTESQESVSPGAGGSAATNDEEADVVSENEPVIEELVSSSPDSTTPADDELPYTVEAPTTSNDNLVFTVESDTQFSFNKNECTRIEDGTFYCQKQSDITALEDSLLAAPDNDGDLEIYLVRDGERFQITQNEVDDASPYYDELSNTIVWHRLLNDRYQIISYDIESGQESQLTQTNVNNMEPARNGTYTVWQRWVENNWEVILFDGVTEQQITNSARHDIAPNIRGPLVIWSSQSNDGTQELKTYDIQSKTQTTISDSEGVSVSNPRMVVMYEALYENGDIVTKGFDLVSGKIVPLEALPKKLPTELPDAEPTEEVRALIQSKPEPKEVTGSDIAPTSSGNGTSTASTTQSVAAVTATSTAQVLDLRSLSTPELVRYLTEEKTATSTIPDVVIPSEVVDITPTDLELSTSTIPDLVIESQSAPEQSAASTQIVSD